MKLKNKIIHPDRIEDRSETIKEREKLKIKKLIMKRPKSI